MSGPIELLFVVEEAEEGGYVARGVGADVFAQADTLESLRDAVREAVECHFDPGKAPRLIHLHIVRDEVLTV